MLMVRGSGFFSHWHLVSGHWQKIEFMRIRPVGVDKVLATLSDIRRSKNQ
jgi:hypothetical protein